MRRFNATIKNLEYRLRKFKADLPRLLERAVLENEDVIIEAITTNQLYRRGINGMGVKIMSYAPYTANTVRRKIKKGQPHTRVTLRDTGEFYDSLRVVFDSDGFYITSDDDKAKYLLKKYGAEIFRLTDENFTRLVRSHIRKSIVKQLKREINARK